MNRYFPVWLIIVVLFTGCQKKKDGALSKDSTTEDKYSNYSYAVSTFKNNVSWSKDDENWHPVSEGLSIQKESYIETGRRSSATLTGSVGDVVMLGELVKLRLEISELLKKSAGQSIASRGIDLIKGKIRVAVKKDPNGFIVETPSAHIKVKGTEFTVSHDITKKSTDVTVFQGTLEISDLKQVDQPFRLNAGYTIEGIGTARPVQRKNIKRDSVLALSTYQSTPDGDVGRVSTENKAPLSSLKKQQLENEKSGTSSAAVINERVRAQTAIDSVRSEYQAAVEAEKASYNVQKKKAMETIDSTKTAAKTALENEREKYRNNIGGQRNSTMGSSDDAFDELHRRKQQQ